MRSLLQSIINALSSVDADAVVGAEWDPPAEFEANHYSEIPVLTEAGTT